MKNILNLSKEDTWTAITLTISNTQPLEEIEAMLDRELPKIGEKTPAIISGPVYLGIDRIDYHRVSIMVSALCRQKDVNKVRRIMNEELWDLFRKNGYQL